MTKSAATRSIVIEREMPHPPEKVWRALTQGPLIAEWLMQNDFQPVVGHSFNFRAAPMPHWNGWSTAGCWSSSPSNGSPIAGTLRARRRRGPQDRRHVDVDADAGRRSRALGTVGLPAPRRSQLPGCQLWLAALSLQPGAGDSRAALICSTPRSHATGSIPTGRISQLCQRTAPPSRRQNSRRRCA